MKICFAVCEYNPFHNGHFRHLEIIKNQIKPDVIAILMSGNFTQRGEVAVTDKFTRAKHAVLSGADVVFELPTVFAVSPAEIFAKGAVKLINSFSGEKVLCFGTESAEKRKLIATASALLTESREFKKAVKEELKTGVPYIKAKVNALSKMDLDDLDFDLLKSPNNILGIEYAKAAISSDSDVDLYPIIRDGAGYNDGVLSSGNPSALAIRNAISKGEYEKIKEAVPPYVFADLPNNCPNADDLIMYSILATDKSYMRRITDCTEGLENRIKALARTSGNLTELKEKLKTKRYTYTRLNRILTSCMLRIDNLFVKKCLREDLYLKVLAIKKERTNVLSEISASTGYPLLTRKSDSEKLRGIAAECFEKDVFANEVYGVITGKRANEHEMKIV